MKAEAKDAGPGERGAEAALIAGAVGEQTWQPGAEAARTEERFRRLFVPGALLFAFLFTATGFGGRVARLISGMWLHELGHAVAAWSTGHAAVPLPWFTSISPGRGFFITLMWMAGFGYLAFRAHRGEQRARTGGFAVLALAGLVGRLLPSAKAQAFITFFGDGGAMVFGVLLVCSFYSAPGSVLYRGALRWGLGVLGAIGFADAYRTWWRADVDPGEIPFGRIEGVGLSDASRMVDWYGWTEVGLVDAYVVFGGLCLAALAVVYGLGLGRLPAAAFSAGPEA